MELMKDWVRSLFLILLAITFIEMLLPESSMGKYLRFIFSLVIMAGAFLASCVFEVNVIYVVIASGLIGALRTWIRGRRKKA